jgi:hypothetical protein
MPSFAGAMVGLGEGITVGGKMLGDFFAKSALQEEAAKIQAMRDETLARYQTERDTKQNAEAERRQIAAEERARAPYREAAEESSGIIGNMLKERNPVANDDEGNPMPQATLKPQEEAKVRSDAYAKRGLVDAAQRERGEMLQQDRMDLEKANAESARGRDERQHSERMVTLERQLKNQERQIELEGRKFGLMAQEHNLKQEDANIIRAARNAYVAEKDPEKKIELGAQLLTLQGKMAERWKAIESVDPNTGAKSVTGMFDQASGRVMGPEGRGGRPANAPAVDPAMFDPNARKPRPAPQAAPAPQPARPIGDALRVSRQEIEAQMARLSELQDEAKHPEIPERDREAMRAKLRELGMQLRNAM